jgi:hypothetical protein
LVLGGCFCHPHVITTHAACCTAPHGVGADPKPASLTIGSCRKLATHAAAATGDRQAEGLRGLEIDDELVFGRLLYRQVAEFRALEDLVIAGRGQSTESRPSLS